MKIILREEKRLLSEKELAILIATSSAQYLSRFRTFSFFLMVLIIKKSYTEDRKVKVEEIAI